MKFCNYMNSDWFKKLENEVKLSNKAAVATKMGISRSTLSAMMNGLAGYGTGQANTKNIETKYRQAYEQLTCSHTRDQVGIEYCRDIALSPAPTQNPIKMMHWQACQSCPHKPKAAQSKEPVQQAGIIDKVTLPLPVVGAPQVMEAV